MHVRSAAGKRQRKAEDQPAQTLVRQSRRGHTNGDDEVTFNLKRPQPSLLSMLATGWTPIYPCHVSPAQMRQHPIGTGPFKFVGFKPNQSITLTRNTDYWKPGRPYLDGIEYRIIKDVSTRLLSFIAGNEEVYFGVTMTQLKDVKNQLPEAICDMLITNVARNLLVNREVAAVRQRGIAAGDHADARPPGLYRHHRRRAGCDRRRHAAAARGRLGHAALCDAQPARLRPRCRGEPRPGAQDHGEAGLRSRQAAEVTMSTRNIAPYRDPAVILISQLKEIYIDADSTRSTRRNGIRR